MGKIRSFSDLNAWQHAHELVLLVYKTVDGFPEKERYILTSQVLRAAISITSNISEGFSRRGRKEKIQFYSVSLGSFTGLQNQIILARDLNYLEKND